MRKYLMHIDTGIVLSEGDWDAVSKNNYYNPKAIGANFIEVKKNDKDRWEAVEFDPISMAEKDYDSDYFRVLFMLDACGEEISTDKNNIGEGMRSIFLWHKDGGSTVFNFDKKSLKLLEIKKSCDC